VLQTQQPAVKSSQAVKAENRSTVIAYCEIITSSKGREQKYSDITLRQTDNTKFHR
jgi:hypothetical protein